jgi:hypothetical protein
MPSNFDSKIALKNTKRNARVIITCAPARLRSASPRAMTPVQEGALIAKRAAKCQMC